MKVAIAYDWLNVKHGGGEDTLIEIAKLYPDADIHCLIYNKKRFSSYFSGHKVITSHLQYFPGFIKKRPFLLLPFIRRAITKMNFEGYDLVISVSSAWVKNIVVPEKTVHISYCFSPARMIWDSWPHYLDTQKIGPFKLGAISQFFITKSVSKIRLWDYYSTEGVDEFISISQYISTRIQKFYHRKSIVVYPPVNTASAIQTNKSNYYLVLSVLSQYKNIDLIIKAFMKNKHKLIIAGDGPDRVRLEKSAIGNPNIEFVGRVSDKRKHILLAEAKALLFPGIEDFGITPIEALAHATPVITLKAGGLGETIGTKTGVFFTEPTEMAVNDAITEFENKHFIKNDLIASAETYSLATFQHQFTSTINTIYKKEKKK